MSIKDGYKNTERVNLAILLDQAPDGEWRGRAYLPMVGYEGSDQQERLLCEKSRVRKIDAFDAALSGAHEVLIRALLKLRHRACDKDHNACDETGPVNLDLALRHAFPTPDAVK